MTAKAGETTIELRVNGDEMTVERGLTVRGLIERIGLGAGPVAVEKNGVVVQRRDHETTVLAGGDRLEIVHFVGGG